MKNMLITRYLLLQ